MSRDYFSLEARADAMLEKFLSFAESRRDFQNSMERVDARLERIGMLDENGNELELNEITVLADALEAELSKAEKSAPGAAISERQEEWTGAFESVRDSLDMMAFHIAKMRAARRKKAGSRKAQPPVAALKKGFEAESERCRARLLKLEVLAGGAKNGRTGARLEAARKRVGVIRAGVGQVLEKIAKARMRKRIAGMKEEISQFMKSTGRGRIFVDHRHMTFSTGSRKMRLPFTQAARFSLEEIAPLGNALENVGNGKAVAIGSYEFGPNWATLRIGERTISGDTVIYRERSFGVKGTA